MAAGKYSFIIEQGATTNFQINWNDETGSAVDLSGYQARMQIRPTIESSDVFLSLSSSLRADNTGINLSGSNFITPLASGSIYEVGTSNTFDVSGTITNDCDFTLSGGTLTAEGALISRYGTAKLAEHLNYVRDLKYCNY